MSRWRCPPSPQSMVCSGSPTCLVLIPPMVWFVPRLWTCGLLFGSAQISLGVSRAMADNLFLEQ